MDPRYSQRDRIKALQSMHRPPIEMLLKLINSEATPPRIKSLCVELYDCELTVRRGVLAAKTGRPAVA
jgi:hypothetical protein